MILTLCDELDKSKELLDYFKKTLLEHINSTIIVSLKKKKDEVLLKEYVHEWKNYTILTHFMRKMFDYLVRFTIFQH